MSHLLDQLVRHQRVSESVLLECFVFVSTSVMSNAAQNSTGRAEAFTNVILVDWLVSVCISCCTEMSVTTFCLGVFSGISLRLVSTVGGGCRCKLWPASMCHSLVSQNGKERRAQV